MGWSIGDDVAERRRFIGYGVPAYCDHPKCDAKIDRGLAYICGGQPCGGDAYGGGNGGDRGCGMFFCEAHRSYGELCPRCTAYKPPYKRIKPEHPKWIHHVLTDDSWAEWRDKYPAEVARYSAMKPLANPEGAEA